MIFATMGMLVGIANIRMAASGMPTSEMRSQGRNLPFLNLMRSIRPPKMGPLTASYTLTTSASPATAAAEMPTSVK